MSKKNHHARLAKLSPPRLNNVIPRDRLYQQLDELRDYPVIWLSAPGGSGKTMLLASYLQQRQVNALWYQIDDGDADPGSFVDYLKLALQQAGVSIHLPAYSPEYLAGIDAFARQFSRDMYAGLADDSIIVLDNFQDLPADSVTHRILLQFIREIPSGINLVMISRNEPDQDYCRFRVDGTLSLLGQDMLALNAEESGAICQRQLAHLDKKQVRQMSDELHRITRGWAAGLVLLLEQSSDNSLPQTMAPADNPLLVFDYFAGEIFQREAEDTRLFLLKTALLPLFTVDIARQLTGHPQTETLLQNLTHRNYFTYRSAAAAEAYEYHPLFREFLLSRIETAISARELREVQLHAGELLEAHGWAAEAASLYCQAKEWSRLEALVTRHGDGLLQTGRHVLLNQWLRSFPLEYLETHPWMEYWLGMSMQLQNTRDSRNHFMRVYEKFTDQDDRRGQLAAWCAVVETYIHDMATFEPLDHWIELVEASFREGTALPDAEINARVSVAMFSALMYRQPDHAHIDYWEQRVRELIFNTPDMTRRLSLASQLLLYYSVWTGELPKATVLLKALQPTMQPEQLGPLPLILWQATLATYQWKVGDNVACIKSVKRGLEVAGQYDLKIYNVLLLASGIYATCAQKRFDQAADYLLQMEQQLDRGRLVDVVHYHYLAAGLAIIRGELGMAREYAETALDAGIKCGALYPETLARLILSLCLIRQGNLAEVVFHLSRISDLAERINSHGLNYLNRLVASEAAFSCGEVERGVGFLKQAYAHERDLGRVYHGFWWDRSLAENCIQALDENLEVEFIQQLIRSHELIPANAPLHLDNWVWPFRVYTLGRFSITHYDKPLSMTSKSSKKPLELFKLLIAQGGRQVSQETLIALLWPDSEGDAAAQSLYTTTHRLRKMLSEHAIIMQDGRLSIDPAYIWVDCLAFQRIAGRLQDLLKARPIDRDRVASMSAWFFQLYQGSFMGKGDMQSAYMPMQEKLRQRFMHTAEHLGQYWLSQGELDRASQCFEAVLSIDPVAEEFYCHLMRAQTQAGQYSDAAQTYQRCRKNLASILGISPSKNTVEIYRSLQQSG